MTWIPRPCFGIYPEVCLSLSARWMCQQLIRANVEILGIWNGVNTFKSLECINLNFRTEGCNAVLSFKWQRRTVLWKLRDCEEHGNECFGEAILNSTDQTKSSYCVPVYIPHQAAQTIINEAYSDPKINSKMIESLIKSKKIYDRKPSTSHC